MRRPRLSFAVAAAALLALLALALAPLSQAKVVVNGIGPAGTMGGQLGNTPRGIAVNNTGAGGAPAGTFYVVDGNQNRVQRFSPAGTFERLWGWNVIGRGEQQLIQVSGVNSTAGAGGTFTLTFGANTTGAIAANAAANVVQSALTALPSIGAGNATVAGNANSGWTVTFTGALIGTNVAQLVPNGAGLLGPSPSISVTTLEDGAGGTTNTFEICTTASLCNVGATAPTTANGGQLNNPQGIAVNQANGHVYVTENGNRRVSEFDANGNFVRAWGQGVATGSAILFETCTTTAGCRQAAAAGGMAGQLGGTVGYPVTDSSNNVWVPDQANFRIQQFSPTGAFLKMAGGGVVSGGAEGTGNLSSASTTVSALNTTKKAFVIGQTVTGPGLKPSTTITNIATGASSTLTLSQTPAESKTGTTITAAEAPGNVPNNERQTVTLGANTVGGTFTLTLPARQSFAAATTAAIPFNASATELEAKLAALGGLSGNVSVTSSNPGGGTAFGGPYTVEFGGTRYADTNIPQMTATAGGLSTAFSSGAASVTIVTTQEGASGAEVCSVASQCQAGAPGSGLGQFGASSPGDVAFDSSGNVFALDPGNKRVQRFNAELASAANFGATSLAPYTSNAPERLASGQGGARLEFGVNNTLSANERQIVEVDPADGNVTDTSLAGAGLNGAIGGLAESAGGTLYATTGATASPRRVLALSATPLPDPVIVNNPIVTKTDATATFSGTVDPVGGLVTCKFQYSVNQSNWTDVTSPGCASLEPGGGAQAVSANATGLVPNTHYYVRLVVSRLLVGKSAKNSSVQEFDTDSMPPVVSNVGIINVQDVSARLVGTIDPRHADTEYVFHYGTTAGSLDSSTAPVSIGDGAIPLTVTQLVSGLTPGTTYYFQLVATGPFGSSASAEGSFVTRVDPLPLPEDRGYEQVTPGSKGFGNIDDAILSNFKFTIAENGNALGYCNVTAGGAQLSQYCGDYISQRTTGGWDPRPASPVSCGVDTETTGIALKAGDKFLTFSRDLKAAAIMRPENASCGAERLDPAAPLPGTNLYRESFDTPQVFNLLAPARAFNSTGPEVSYPFHALPEGGSSDFSHIVYSSSGDQSGDSVPVDGTRRIYEWDEGTIRLVSRDTSNAPFSVPVTLAGNPDPITGPRGSGYGAVSEDGNRILFQASVTEGGRCEAANCELYMRENGSVTHWISEQECSSACSNTSGPDLARWATPDGDKIVFGSTAKLNDEDLSTTGGECEFSGNPPKGCDFYIYRHSANPSADKNLTLLSADHEPADGTAADVWHVLGLSDDGDTVYFVASGQIVAGAPIGTGLKAYRWRWNDGSPTVQYLARFATGGGGNGDQRNWSYIVGTNDRTLIRRVTPDGKYLFVGSVVQLDPIADQDADRDVYRWSEQDGWLCLSCQLPGSPSAGDSSIEALSGLGQESFSQIVDPVAVSSDDGSRVFFTTADALVPEDINGEQGCPELKTVSGTTSLGYRCQDVYEWHGGTVSLISGGTGSRPSKLVGASRSGNDVFFLTVDRMVGWDTDGLYDVYDARVGGGFPEPPPSGAVCEGEACREAGTTAPSVAGAGTGVFEGPGNSPTEKVLKCRKGLRKVKVKGRVVCKKPGQAKRSRKRHQRHASGGGR